MQGLGALASPGGAIFDLTRAYRYSLWRCWDPERPRVTFILLNPSTADAARDDPTIRRCRRFARDWGYGSFEVVNLFAYRATHARDLVRADDPIGAEADHYLFQAVARSNRIVAGWGNNGALRGRDHAVLDLLHGHSLHCLGVTKQGKPRHPLYIPSAQETLPYCGI